MANLTLPPPPYYKTLKDLPLVDNQGKDRKVPKYNLTTLASALHQGPGEGFRFVYYNEVLNDNYLAPIIGDLNRTETEAFVINGKLQWLGFSSSQTLHIGPVENCGVKPISTQTDYVLVVEDTYWVYTDDGDE